MPEILRSSSVCQLCSMVGHNAYMCSKLYDRPKHGKCGRGHKTKNYRLKCSYYFGLGHTKEQCWKKNGRRLVVVANYLEVLINDEKATLAKLNRLCGENNNIFSGTRIPKQRNLVVAPEVDRNKEEVIEKGGATQQIFGNEMSITKSKILTHFLKCKISFTPLETILIIPNKLGYLEGLVKLAKRWNDEEVQQVIHVYVVTTIPDIKQVNATKVKLCT